MTVTLTGADFKRFYADSAIWGPEEQESYVEDTVYSVNGSEPGGGDDFDAQAVADHDLVTIHGGYLVNAPAGVPEDYVDAAIYWRRLQTHGTMVIRFPLENRAALIAAIEAAGGEVIVGDASAS